MKSIVLILLMSTFSILVQSQDTIFSERNRSSIGKRIIVNNSKIADVIKIFGKDFEFTKKSLTYSLDYADEHHRTLISKVMFYKESGITFITHGNVKYKPFKNNKISLMEFSYPFSGCTEYGIKIGDPIEMVINKYGNDYSLNKQKDEIIYINRGIRFFLDKNSKVMKITVT
jgi:hypothetical protein